MEIDEEISYGVIPFYKTQEGEWRVLLVHHQKGHWAFPKGHPEQGEGSREAALRELTEETGIQSVTLSSEPVATETYRFTENGQDIKKMVTYFLGVVSDPEVTINKEELVDARWMSKDAADDMITFTESREVLKRAWTALCNTRGAYV